MKKVIFILVLTILQCINTFAQNVNTLKRERPLLLFENNGQIINQERKEFPEVKMLYTSSDFKIAIKNNGMSYEFIKQNLSPQRESDIFLNDTLSPIYHLLKEKKYYDCSRIDIIFLNSNLSPELMKEGKYDYYENYHNEVIDGKQIQSVYGYTKAILRNVWNHIDIEFIINPEISNSFKYNFIIHPGGSIQDIKLLYNGSQPQISNDTIIIKTDMGEINEFIPQVFYRDNTYSKDEGEPQVKYSLNSNIISFVGKNIQMDKGDLIIDPQLIWSSYIGGSNADAINGIASDSANNIYIVGTTQSTSNIVSNGSYQSTLAGGYDVFISKFSSQGTLVWSTYYGGSGDDAGEGITVDLKGEIAVVAATNSSSGVATSGSLGGNWDALVIKFTNSGSRIWGAYRGGSNLDMGLSVKADDSGNVYINGYTNSVSGISTPGSYQANNSGNSNDLFLTKYSSSGTVQWSTFYGGTGDELTQIGSLSLDDSANIYFSGYTNSTSGIASGGTYQSSNAGGLDAFLVKFSKFGQRIWGTYFGGSNAEHGYNVLADRKGSIYISGNTNSTSGIATNGAYRTTIAGGYDIYLAKFTSGGRLMWATYYGGSLNEGTYGIGKDIWGNIYITSSAISTSGIATASGYQTTISGAFDGFIAQFSTSGFLKWGTYYGGPGNEYVYTICSDNIGNIYIAGRSESTSNIATSGAFQVSNNGNFDGFITKFNFALKVDASLTSLEIKDTICEGKMQINAYLKNQGKDTLYSDSIYWTVNGNIQLPIKWSGSLLPDSSVLVNIGSYSFLNPGVHYIKVWIKDANGAPDSLPENDTIYKSIFVNLLPKAFAGFDTSICRGSSLKIGSIATNGLTYKWTSNPNGFYDTIANPMVFPQISTSYILSVSTGTCPTPVFDTINVWVDTATFYNIVDSVCKGEAFLFNKIKIYNPGIYYDTLINAKGCDSIISLNLKVLSPSYMNTDDSICSGGSVFFGGKNLSKAGIYYDTLINAVGCDSVVTLNLKVKTPNMVSIKITICLGSIYYFGGRNISAPGIYYDTLNGVKNCDSIIELDLSVSSRITSNLNANICDGDQYIFAGNILKTQGIYYDTLKSYQGCDSVVVLNLKIYTLPHPIITGGSKGLCDGDSVVLSIAKYKKYLWSDSSVSQSIVVKSGGKYSVTVVDSNGCKATSDSLLVIVHPKPLPVILITNKILRTGVYKSYQWYLNNLYIPNASSQTFNPLINGIYKVKVIDSNGCSGISNDYSVNWVGINSVEKDQLYIYPNPTNGNISLEFDKDKKRRVSIYNIFHQLVLQGEYLGQMIQIELGENLDDGLYFIVIEENDSSKVYKVVKLSGKN